MKIIMSILLIIVMGMSNQKEQTMIREDGKREVVRTTQALQTRTPAVQKPPAWLGKTEVNKGERDNTPAPAPSLWDTIRNRLNNSEIFGATSLGGGNAPVPNFNTQQSFNAADARRRVAVMDRTSLARDAVTTVPAWMQTAQTALNSPNFGVTSLGGGNAPVPNFNTPRSITQGQQNYQQNNDGNVYNNNESGVTPQGTPTFGTDSFIGGGGDAVIGPNQNAYTPWTPLTSTFLAANNQAVRYAEPMAYAQPNTGGGGSGGSGYGFGTKYKGWGGGGGGGGWGDGGGDRPAWLSNDPQYMNLYSWNYKG